MGFTDEEFVRITLECPTMALAAKKLRMSYKNFALKAKELGCYKPNKAKKGF